MKVRAVVLGAVAAVVLALYTWHHPVHADVAFDPRLLVAPQLAKIAGVLRTFALLALLNVAAYGASRPLATLLWPRDADDPLEKVSRIAFGFAALSVVVLVFAALHLLRAPFLLAMLVAAALLDVRGLVARLRSHRPAARGSARRTAVLVAAAGLVGIPALRAFDPLPGWDALTYHLAIPEVYVRANSVVVSPFSAYTGFPHAVEMLYALSLAIDGTPLARLVHTEFGALVLIAVYAVARRYASPRAGLLAIAVFLADPMFTEEMSTAYNDLALALYALVATASFARWRSEGAPGALARAAVAGGACVAVRYPGALVPIVLAVLAIVPAAPRMLRARISAAGALVAGALAGLAPWAVRNAICTGNPLAPLLEHQFSALGMGYFDALSLDQALAFTHAIGMGRGPLQLLALPWHLTIDARSGTYVDGFGYVVGPLYLVALVAVVLAMARPNRDPFIRTMMGFAGASTVAWFYSSQEARYLYPCLVALALAGAVAADGLVPRTRVGSALLGAVPLLATVLAWTPVVPSMARVYGFALGNLSADTAEADEPAAAAARFVRAHAGSADRVLLLFEPRGFYFRGLDYIPYHTMEGSPVLQMVSRASDPHDVACRLALFAPDWIVVNQSLLTQMHATYVPEYPEARYARDLRLIDAYLHAYTTPVRFERGVLVVRPRPAPSDCPTSAPGAS